MSKPYRLAIVIGRFQIPHNGHVALLKEAASIADNVAVMIGSSHIARNFKNPFRYAERSDLIHKILRYESVGVYTFPLVDNLYSDQQWATQVQTHVNSILAAKFSKDVVLVGHNKDESSYYLRLFPQWDYLEHKAKSPVDATVLRRHYFREEPSMRFIHSRVPQDTYDFLSAFELRPEYKDLVEERYFLDKYHSQFESYPYGQPIFQTVDAVVVCGSNVLLIRRRANPGKGQWALPGGFLNTSERILDGILRELNEETVIKVPEQELRASLKHIEYFDAPGRSLRGRIITHAGLIILNRIDLPDVVGSDDAEKAAWFGLDEVRAMPEKMFEDHLSIINRMTSLIR